MCRPGLQQMYRAGRRRECASLEASVNMRVAFLLCTYKTSY